MFIVFVCIFLLVTEIDTKQQSEKILMVLISVSVATVQIKIK